ncbi:MAG: asparagine synthase (glutamine-hydrolyzing) [Gemmatimonadales bacterium]
MCGIAGFQGLFDRALLHAMTTSLAHRGPDGEGIELFGDGAALTGFGHRRLSIIDISSHGRQPMTVECPACGASGLSDLALTYNGEIYNYQELRARLVARGHRFHSATDSEVLLHLYADQGPDMLGLLNGIFAFAIRDGRTNGRPGDIHQGDVLVARDHFGVKPLYYTSISAGVLFGSEIKALLQCAQVPRDINLTALHHHLSYLWSPGADTMLAAVKKVEPGAAMVLRDGQIARSWYYYDIPYGGDRDRRSERELVAELRDRIHDAVRRQLVSDVPVGAFLSGGIDSASVVAAMCAAGHRPTCFGIGFGPGYRGEENPDDLPYARIAARHLNVPLVELIVDPSMLNDLERMLYYLDEPQADLAPLNALMIADKAREAGIPVLLSGAGGDDILAGYRRHRAVQLESWWSWLPSSVRGPLGGVARWVGSGRSGLSMHGGAARRAVKAFSFANLDDDRRLASYFWWSPEQLRWGLYSDTVKASLTGVDTAAPLLATLARIPTERSRLNRVLYLESKHFLPDHNLNYTDRMGMARGVEVRVPFLDRDLVDFAARIPPELKYQGSVSKTLLKKAMAPSLPPEIISRPKSGFGVPLRGWMRNELMPIVDDTLSARSLSSRGFFNPEAVQRLVALDRRGAVDGSYTLLAIMCIELWCRMFVDRTPMLPAHG